MKRTWLALGIIVIAALGYTWYRVRPSGGQSVVVRLTPEASQPRVPLGEAGLDPAAVQEAADYAGRRRSSALIIGRGGHIVFEKYWGSAAFDAPVDPGFAPVLLALTVGSALNDRLITSLDTPLSNYIADFPGSEGAITVRELLARDRSDLSLEDSADLLALLTERVAAQPYQVLVAQRLWAPLGGGDLEFQQRPGRWRANGVSAACCVRARVGDWMRMGEALANDGIFEGNQLTPPRYVELMLKPAHRDATRGYFTRVDGNFAVRDVAWLEGSNKQRMWVVPSLRLVILRLGEEPGSEGWDEAMIPNCIIRGTSGWKPAAAGQGVDPSLYAPH
jgi:CubicO group peptidase (beta-lactamase class C family)